MRTWLVNSALDSVEGRVMDCAYSTRVSGMPMSYLAFSLWLVSNKVTQLWLRTDT